MDPFSPLPLDMQACLVAREFSLCEADQLFASCRYTYHALRPYVHATKPDWVVEQIIAHTKDFDATAIRIERRITTMPTCDPRFAALFVRLLTNIETEARPWTRTDVGFGIALKGCGEHLEVFNPGKGTRISDAIIASLADQAKGLKKLVLSECKNLTDRSIVRIAHACGKTLKEIDLSYMSISEESIAAISAHCSNLTQLDLTACEVTDDALLTLEEGSCFELRRLTLSSCERITNVGVSAALRGCTQLTQLTLPHTIIADEDLVTIASHGTNLKVLNLSGCKRITDTGVRVIAQGCVRLALLILDWTNISDESLIALATYAKALEGVCVYNCARITDAGVLAIAKGCRGLAGLQLGSTDVSDEGLISLATWAKLLKALYLANCQHITDSGVRAILQGCPHLIQLDLEGTAISPEVQESARATLA